MRGAGGGLVRVVGDGNLLRATATTGLDRALEAMEYSPLTTSQRFDRKREDENGESSEI